MKSEPVVKSIDIKYGAIILESECDEECVANLILAEMEELVKEYANKKNDFKKVKHVKL